MRISKIINIIFITFILSSCQERDNIELTDFTKELVALYISDTDNANVKNRKDEIIIISTMDTLFHYLSIFANDNKAYVFCREDIVGQTIYLGHSIRVFGVQSSSFYSIKEGPEIHKTCRNNSIEYDPSIWHICFRKDMSFYKMRTYKVSPYEDISAIQRLAEKYFEVSEIIYDDIYQSYEVENEPTFILGEDSLRHIISSNFNVYKQGNFGKNPLVVGIIIDKKGRASLSGIIKSSNDTELDDEAIRVAKIICQYDFIPASHRNEFVNVIYPIVFLKNDIEH